MHAWEDVRWPERKGELEEREGGPAEGPPRAPSHREDSALSLGCRGCCDLHSLMNIFTGCLALLWAGLHPCPWGAEGIVRRQSALESGPRPVRCSGRK